MLAALAGIGVLTASTTQSWADDPPAAPAAGESTTANDQPLADQVHALQERVDQLSKQAAAPKPEGEAKAKEEPPKSGPPPITWHGITLYGTIDVEIAHLTHGAPLSNTYPASLPFVLQAFSNRPITSIANNGLSQSRIGLSGAESLGIADLKAVFKLETGFQPTSGRLSDGPQSLVDDNGVANDKKITSGDSGRAGQVFNSVAYVGLSSPTYGTLTFGRQNSLMADDLLKYDPQLQSQSFSPISYSGTSGGFGDTEDKTLDSSLKYVVGYGPVHVMGQYQFGHTNYEPEGAYSVDVGAEIEGLSIDAIYGKVKGAIAASSLSAAQVATSAPGTLAATVSDNTGYSVMALYKLSPVKIFGAYEHITYANPEKPMIPGTVTIGSYVLSNINNTAFTIEKKLDYFWGGIRYQALPQLELAAAYYLFLQNDYNAKGCTDNSAGSCSGTFHDVSFVADYRLSPRFDVYAGLNYTTGSDGLAAGFINTSNLATAAGIRFQF